MRGLRDGLSQEEPQSMGRTRQQTRSMQSHHQHKKVQFKNDDSQEAPQSIKNESKYHLHHQGCFVQEYSSRSAHVFAQIVEQLSHIQLNAKTEKDFYSFVQQYGLGKGIQKFGMKGKEAAISEMKQLHDRVVFTPIDVSQLTQK